MELIMCRSCGHFQPAVRRDDSLEPLRNECEKCDGETFQDVRTDEVPHADV